jgi:hypothetical protein
VNPTQPPLPPPPSKGPSTREIPLAQPESAPSSQQPSTPLPSTQQLPIHQPSAAAAVASQPQHTGPVDYVPGPPPAAGAAGPPPLGQDDPPRDFFHRLAEDEPHQGRDPRRIIGILLAALAVVLLQLGLLVHEAGVNLWSHVPLWSGFATLAAVVGLAGVAGPFSSAGDHSSRMWRVAAGGLAGSAVFWVLVVLPLADSNRGFVLTAALACLGGAVWLAVAPRPDREG